MTVARAMTSRRQRVLRELILRRVPGCLGVVKMTETEAYVVVVEEEGATAINRYVIDAPPEVSRSGTR